MKIRILDDSLRLRLSSTDVSGLVTTGCVRNETAFGPNSTLICVLRSCREAKNIVASFESKTVCVEVPQQMIAAWATSDQIGITAQQQIEGQRSLTILVEKDFECLDPTRNEPGLTLFENPLKPRS